MDPKIQQAFLKSCEPHQIEALPYLFEFWAHPHQLPPEGDWRTWIVLGGRGAGKTRAGAEWVRHMLEGPRPRAAGKANRMALIGSTIDQAREVMVFGESGILAVSPPDRRPKWVAGRKMLIWPNGATAQIFSAFDPESLRGPQFDTVWADELAKWHKPQDVWDMMQFGLRLGEAPRACVTTTPKNISLLKDLLARDNSVVTHATSFDNMANLAPGFLEEMAQRYQGTRLGRQELEGVVLTDAEGALWRSDVLSDLSVLGAPDLTRVIVAVDPPVTGHKGSDDCGIIVVGAITEGPPHTWRAYVLEDATMQAASPIQWARAAVAAAHRHGASRIVAETNQGGDMVESVLRQVDQLIPYKKVHARTGKVARAEPVAAIYEQGRVFHLRGLGELEDQMCMMTTQGYEGPGSPDRVDALVWGLSELMIEPSKSWVEPRVRGL